ncbi:DUF3047 domain-containing protein [Methylomonas sp. LW13]|uniref:DUF3047 domain-containing protein n=1 Tax=unclassified Methylomonas TaxID=2608980 RepID=UPI00051C4BD9|nr:MULTISPECIES: DUF3047 domain-containing protein [unclassified Methylomonas]PKD39657.1 DUF3047 domain-containing protein [Methylomonas sp. Kb3]QBC27752.1 DUF3047 domain-containing protein [Methylomonas sp. LW13]
MKKFCWIFLTMLSMNHGAVADNKLPIGEFSQNRLEGWEHKSFKGETEYSLQAIDGVTVLTADSRAAGSGMFKEQHIDLEQTPFLNWSWRIGKRLNGLNEQSKPGDDYAARVYVVVKGGLAFWQTKAINYVWAGNTKKDTVWPNAFAGDHAMMLALRGPEASLNVWQTEKRNVRADFKKLFGEDITAIDAVAIMTDTDNNGGQAAATYGDIWFSKD